MQSILYLPASDGTANASLMTVQTLRSPGASAIIVNTVTGVHTTGFHATMGAPHTFTDPVTSEVITVISDATAVDFAGHINAGQIIIDAIAPGYVDTRGSLVGDIVIIRPTTDWSNNVANVLGQSLNADGTLKAAAITYNPNVFDHIFSGAILAGLGYASTLTASLSAGICYINGNMQTIAAVATRTYTASKDTYVDALYSSTGTATLVYTEVANNAASPALAANSIRLGIVVTGTNIAAATSINQGQETMVLPIASGVAYSVTDSLGNLIAPRDPNRKILGYRQRITDTGNIATGGADTSVAGLLVPVQVPLGRKVKVTVYNPSFYNVSGPADAYTVVYDGVIGSGGVKIGEGHSVSQAAGYPYAHTVPCVVTPTATSKTYTAGVRGAGAGTIVATTGVSANEPMSILVELA